MKLITAIKMFMGTIGFGIKIGGWSIDNDFFCCKKNVLLFFSLMFFCCFSCNPPDYPECMNGFVCYAYVPEGADSVKVDLFYEGLLVESEKHSEIVGLPEKKYFFYNPIEIRISVFCKGMWLSGKKLKYL